MVEYRELRHDPPMPHFDKPNRLTVSGEQRGLYEWRDERIPAHGLRLVLIRPADLNADGRGRMGRNEAADLAALKTIPARVRADGLPRRAADLRPQNLKDFANRQHAAAFLWWAEDRPGGQRAA
ncbi:hypothetical protein [Streptomyces yangpuensis]